MLLLPRNTWFLQLKIAFIEKEKSINFIKLSIHWECDQVYEVYSLTCIYVFLKNFKNKNTDLIITCGNNIETTRHRNYLKVLESSYYINKIQSNKRNVI